MASQSTKQDSKDTVDVEREYMFPELNGIVVRATNPQDAKKEAQKQFKAEDDKE